MHPLHIGLLAFSMAVAGIGYITGRHLPGLWDCQPEGSGRCVILLYSWPQTPGKDWESDHPISRGSYGFQSMGNTEKVWNGLQPH
jgi:hypothetical protein